MANITRRRNSDRTTSFVALVRLKGFDPVSKSFTERADAVAWADQLERELKEQRSRGGLRKDSTTLTIADLVREYTADPVTLARKSSGDMLRLLTWWSDHYDSVRAMELNVLTLRAARDQLRSTGEKYNVAPDGSRTMRKRAAGTVNRHLSAMRACWNWCRANGLIPGNLLWPTGLMLTEPRPRARFLSDAELAKLVNAAKASGPMMHAAVIVSVCTGLRQGELLRLKWSDIDLDNATLRVMESKTDTPRAVYLPAPAVAALKTLREQPVVGAVHVFITEAGEAVDRTAIEHRWRPTRKAAELPNVRWHDLRHCAASYLLQAGASLAEVGSVLGHKSAATTARYAHLVQGKAIPAHVGLAAKMERALSKEAAGEGKQ